MNVSELKEIELDDVLDNSSDKSLDELVEEQDFDPEDAESYYDEDESMFPSLWDKR